MQSLKHEQFVHVLEGDRDIHLLTVCTGAIYWSRIDRVYYGASNEDVARGKGFETDVNVFEGDDHKKPPEDRTRISFVRYTSSSLFIA